MSFNDRFDRWNRLTQMDPESRLAEFRKRFDDFGAQKPLFTDHSPKFAHRWPHMNGVNQSMRSATPEADDSTGIPIKVFHEKPDDRPNSESNERNSDNMSSNASHKSSDTSHTGASGASASSSGSVFDSTTPMDTESPSSQPRVHHIPIRVEPRTGSTSSGYTSENNANHQSLSRSSSHSSAKSFGSAGQVSRGEKRSPSPANSVSSAHSMNSEKSGNSVKSGHSGNQKPVDGQRVHQIPIKVEQNSPKKSSIPTSYNSKTKTTNATNKTKSGPFVTRIPVSQQTAENESKPEPQVKNTKKLDPLEQINLILTDVKKLETEVCEFKGMANEAKYKYLDEMLTRCMIKLDTIETDGNEILRKARKEAILAVHNCITLLEQKVDNNNNQTNLINNETKEEPMEVSSTTGPNGETISEQNSGDNIKEKMDTNESLSKNSINEKIQQNDVNNCSQRPDKIQSNIQPKETAV